MSGRDEQGRYANYCEIGHNAFEFLFDFGQTAPEREDALPHSRIVTSPSCAKALLETLRASIAQYEQRYGPIS